MVDAAGNQVQGTDYYPGGLPTAPFGSTMSAEERLHTGKEFNAFSGLAWYDNAARIYDPLIPRFLQIDPLAEKYPHLSLYAHCDNNPLKFTDKDGKDYGVYIDDVNARITVTATVYATSPDVQSAQEAANYWNGMSCQYQYKGYAVDFSIMVAEVIIPEGASIEQQKAALTQQMAGNLTGEANSYMIVPD